jgi:hypothetical protein
MIHGLHSLVSVSYQHITEQPCARLAGLRDSSSPAALQHCWFY